MPEFRFGKPTASNALHFFPPSLDHVVAITPLRVRQRACNRPSRWKSTLGWMASNLFPLSTGPMISQVLPESRVSSKCTCQPAASPSVLEGHSHVPSASSTGLFLIGPSTPAGNRTGFVQLFPPSAEVIIIPHQVVGEG